jgi:hypothetical protein
MISPAAISMSVFTKRFTTVDACLKNLGNIKTRRKPINRLTSNTFSSRRRIALKVTDPGSSYLKSKESELICTRKTRKSATVQQAAITKMIGNLRLFTIDPVGTISLCKPINKNLIVPTSDQLIFQIIISEA